MYKANLRREKRSLATTHLGWLLVYSVRNKSNCDAQSGGSATRKKEKEIGLALSNVNKEWPTLILKKKRLLLNNREENRKNIRKSRVEKKKKGGGGGGGGS